MKYTVMRETGGYTEPVESAPVLFFDYLSEAQQWIQDYRGRNWKARYWIAVDDGEGEPE